MPTGEAAGRSWVADTRDAVSLVRELIVVVLIAVIAIVLFFNPEAFGETLRRARVESLEVPGFAIKMLEESERQVAQALKAVETTKEQVEAGRNEIAVIQAQVQQAIAATPLDSPARVHLVQSQRTAQAFEGRIATTQQKLGDASGTLQATADKQRIALDRIKRKDPRVE